jgi:DNA-binding YbaB/EbfC family protein
MKDIGALMKQAQAMQAKVAEAQAKLAETSVDGTAGGGLVKVTLRGGGELTNVVMNPGLLVEGGAEELSDLIVAAHADAKRQLDAIQADLMRAAAGPLAGMNLPGMPKF